MSSSTSTAGPVSPPGSSLTAPATFVYTSSHLVAPSPLKTKPKLEDFKYRATNFPAKASPITAESDALDITIHIIDSILQGTRFDQALQFMLDNQVVKRLFEPREVLGEGGFGKAKYQVSKPHHARAMAWFLLGSIERPETCDTCRSEQSKGPFSACVVPVDEDAGGSCTNCWFMKRPAGCSHCPSRPNTPGKKATPDFDGFKMEDLRNATDANLAAWALRMETELRRREEEHKVHAPRGRKRAADEL